MNSPTANWLVRSSYSNGQSGTSEVFEELEKSALVALKTYSNVHRGSGHFSMVTTHLFEQSRSIVLDYLNLPQSGNTVVFCTPGRFTVLARQLNSEDYRCVSSDEIGLSIGVTAVAVKRKALTKKLVSQVGGGTAKLISKDWVIWDEAPDRFEAGTPAIVNVILFGRALQMIRREGKDIFKNEACEELNANTILFDDELTGFSGCELLEKLRQTVLSANVQVPTMKGLQPFIHLDNSASTPTFAPIWDAFRLALRQSGQIKREIVQEVKVICAKMLGAPIDNYEVLFTSNTTEAINLVAGSLHQKSEQVVLNTLLEHSSNELPWRMIPKCKVVRLTVDEEGFVDVKELDRLLQEYNREGLHGNKRIGLVAVSGASNVLGTCNNIDEMARIAHRYGAQILVDAAQLVAHRKIRMERSGIDYLAFSSHKVYAPFGSGALVARKGLLRYSGEEMEAIRRSGEENVGGIAALGKAFVLLQRIGMSLILKEEQELTERALIGMAKVNDLKIYGLNDVQSPGFESKLGVIPFGIGNKMPNKLAEIIALQCGIGVRYGCHCSHLIVKHVLRISPFLEKFQWLIQKLFPKFRFLGVVRVSFGIATSAEEVDKLIEALNELAARKNSSSGNKSALLPQPIVQKQVDEFIESISRKVYICEPVIK